jgi:hypothetical protein
MFLVQFALPLFHITFHRFIDNPCPTYRSQEGSGDGAERMEVGQ